MKELHKDAKILAEAHRDMCGKADCIEACPESSPLYWGKALLPNQPPRAMPVHRTTVAKTLSTVAAVVEQQAQVIDDAACLVNEFDGNPDDIPELLKTLKQVLKRSE
jgi:hypothetical protein